MSTTAYERVLSAADFVRVNWPVDPAASRAFAAELRDGANRLAAGAVNDDDRRKAAAVRRAADAAASAIAELEAAR